ncbi:MAG: metal-dependent transcriptional regulator [Bdellovibrionales bacterium]|nr:metal-dependent transcriptional regulator [Bdellovibrionales bacterium]
MDVWKQFEENSITHSAAHHLLAVMELKTERGYARVTDVAKALNITTGSASTNLKNLKQKGLIIEDDNRFLDLSNKGEQLARAVVARRKIFKRFLIELLGVSQEQAEIDACKTEHLLSHETSEKLLSFMQLIVKNKASKKRSLASVVQINKDASPTSCPLEEGGLRTKEEIEGCPICEDRCLFDDC